MRLKFNIIVFIFLLIAHLFGNKPLTLNIHENYYIFNLMELIVVILLILTGIFLIGDLYKRCKFNI